MESATTLQARLVAALRGRIGEAATPVRLIETHISYVLLTGRLVYKIKKAVRLGFLDFTTLAARRFYCDEELRLNRRHAPSLYLDVVAITGSPEDPQLGGSGPVIEYAVRMAEFAQDALLSNVIARNTLAAEHIDRLAATVARFHERIATAAANGRFGAPDDVLGLALDNFAEIRTLAATAEDRAPLDVLETWTRNEHAARRDLFAERRAGGFVRECHGDLHLGNIALVDAEPLVFDCIEFNDRMRWIDVMSEVAFTVMDLVHRGRSDYAHRFLDAYLETSGDYAGVAVLRFYLVYRAMVRAKIACLRVAQIPAGSAADALWRDYRDLVRIATSYARGARPALIVTHGFAGSGKSVLSQALLEQIGAIRIRSDVERKRLHGLGSLAKSGSGIASDLYAAAATRTTYHVVGLLARAVVAGGFPTIVDATFLARWQRVLFRHFAASWRVPFVMLDVIASERTLRERVVRRAALGGDASEAGLAVLEHQLLTHDPLGDDERDDVVAYDGERPLHEAQAPAAWQGVRNRIEGASQRTITHGAGAASDAARPSARGGEPLEDLAARVAFLARRASYAEETSAVIAVETHMSWVFLTDRHAYKLKKPVRTTDFDLREVERRLQNGVDEVRLNRRLASDVYAGVLPLLRGADGRMTFTGEGEVVDWLVQMRRLPEERMFDRLVRQGRVARTNIDAIVAHLCDYYRRCEPVAMDPAAYRAEFANNLAAHRSELVDPALALSRERVERAIGGLAAMLSRDDLFDARVRAGRIVEGHGDLRPEHICLERGPQIIDCLEFSRRLRTLDPLDELGFLALECERLGGARVGAQILDAYHEHCADAPPAALVHFYQGYRASVRAVLAVRHVREHASDKPSWTARATQYVDLACAHVDRCAT